MESALWVSFWSLLAGVVLAAFGGVLGGRMRRPVVEATRSSRNSQLTSVVPGPASATGVTTTEDYVIDREPIDRSDAVTVTTEDAPRRR